MNWKEEYKKLIYVISAFLIVYFIPAGTSQLDNSVKESLALLKWYAQEHVLLCLVPAFFIAGVISVFVSQAAVIKYFGGRTKRWLSETWSFAKQILPLLGFGVLLAGFFLGVPVKKQGIIPADWITALVGGNSLQANFFYAIVGAFMYFATLTEVPIVQGLIKSGMGKGPALALLLAGPALSLPSMLVIRSVIGTQKTMVYVSLVVIMATIARVLFGALC